MAHKNKKNTSPYKKNLQSKPQVKSRGHITASKIYSRYEAQDRLRDIFENHDFQLSKDKLEKLAHYYQLLMEEQNKQNFTRLTKFRDIAIKHFLDSMIISQYWNIQFPLLDMGTGPGLPGIPLKILFPEQAIYLAEGVQKRVNFLKEVREILELKKLSIFGRNINDSFVYPVQNVITRAVEDIPNTMKNCFHSLQSGGHLIFMKGPRVDQELTIEHPLQEYYDLVLDQAYNIPKTKEERRLVVYKKIKASPQKDLNYFLDRDWKND